MDTKKKIEDSVVENLPVWFGGAVETHIRAFKEAYNKFFEYASSASGAGPDLFILTKLRFGNQIAR
jgi:hypothetical protein